MTINIHKKPIKMAIYKRKLNKRLIIEVDNQFHHFIKLQALSLNMTVRKYVLRSLQQQLQLETGKSIAELKKLYKIYLDQLKKNIENKYIIQNDCWIWTGALGNSGYGIMVLTLNGKKKTFRTHRVSYAIHHDCAEILFDDEIKKESICHTCDIKKCINPDHLVRADQLYNARDAQRKRSYNKKLSEENVLGINQFIKEGYKDAELAKMYNVHPSTINLIRTNKRWSYIKPNEDFS